VVVADHYALHRARRSGRPVTLGAPAMRRARWLIIGGAGIGALLAGREIVGTRATITTGAAAVVNGVVIPRTEFDQALRAAANDRGSPLTKVDEQRVLDRLIGEELLYARALALDLPRRDSRLHAEIVSTFVSEVVAPAETTEPNDAELTQYFEANIARFRGEPIVRVEALLFATADHAVAAVRRLRAGEPIESLNAESERFALSVPTTLSTRETLTAVLGPTAARAAITLPEGDVSEPIVTAAGNVVIRVVERRASTPRMNVVRAQVRAALLRERGEQRLRETIDELRAGADVRIPQ